MSKLALFNVYITERLTAAAVEIVGVVERTVTEYQEEISRSKEENERLRRLGIWGFIYQTVTNVILYTVSEATSASHSLSEGYPGCSAAQSENSGSDNEVESGGLPSGSMALKSPRKQAKKRLSSHTSAGSGATTNAAPPYCCKLCGSTFVYIGPLVNHVKNVHTKLTAEYRCGVCEEVFESIASLTEHLQTHIKATRTCNVCGKCFPSDSSMRTHMVTHTGEKQYQCKECGKCFKNKGYMHLHMRRHTGETPFWCKDCGESFTFLTSELSTARMNGASQGTTETWTNILDSVKNNLS
uniref:C2H2-type domain-containing protein n=1 Tax=Salmo trutta TaxID=8032 RepID=A0A674E6P0_SALTR